MKSIAKILVAAALMSMATSCDTYLDVNNTPNSVTTDTVPPYLVLAQALKVTGDIYGLTLNGYGNWVAGYWAKTGTVNGFNAERTYVYSTTYQQDFWSSTYDNLKDYDIIVQNGPTQGQTYHAAIAKIMKVFDYQLLVDEYGNIPYTESLQGDAGNITPTYDNAEVIYKDFIVKLDEAIATLSGTAPVGTRAVGSEDIIFGGNLTNWVKFANTLKLRILIRQSSVSSLGSYISTEMAKLPTSTSGFVSTDVNVQPGYLQTSGKQNPFWNMYRATAAGNTASYYNWVAGTDYILAQYQSNNDPRLTQLYLAASAGTYNGKYKGVVLGEADPLPGSTQLSRYRTYGGIYKGYDAPIPLMLASESYFLQAEAKTKGYLAGGDAAAKADYNNGIKASFVYYYTPAPSRSSTTSNVSANALPDYEKYLAANTANPLVAWDAAGRTKLEKIIYQKYLAENAVTSIEAWNDYRRTGFPNIPASLQSASTRPDKLPVRLLYPQTELNTNSENVPKDVNQFTSRIFWDVN